MFKIDDIVMYGVNGVCRIVGMEEKKVMDTTKTYFVLTPVNGDKSTYFVPSDNEKLLNKIRKLLSEDEIKELIDSIPNEKSIWIDNDRERKEQYKKIIAGGEHLELIRMIKAIHIEKKNREENGKKIHLADEQFLKEAEKILNDEFEYVLKTSKRDIVSYIIEQEEKCAE